MDMNKIYEPAEAEPKWQKYWEEEKIFKFDQDPQSRAEVFSVDTPPPTVSGKMHIGHAFSYSQQDFIVRFQRMRAKNVFCPFGTDDNGLPTDKLVEKLKGVKSSKMDRKEYTNLVLKTLDEIRPEYISAWKRIGMSCEWDMSYTTINEHCQKISQQSFIDLYNDGRAYRKDAPTMWCPTCHTAISQVECVDESLESYFNDIIFKVDNNDVIVATTRPELLPACVAVIFNPEDTRYKHLLGKTAKVPLFDFEVPIIEDKRVAMDKGTGIVMCCTFGDQTDMEWQKAFNLQIKEAFTKDGKMSELAGEFVGVTIKEGRKKIIDSLKVKGLLVKQQKIKHDVNVHERCGTEIEYMKAKQWFIKYLDLKEKMTEWGDELNWHPEHMKNRYQNWVGGLQWDWLISRQRFYGVPFPVWYCKGCGEVVLAEKLPTDPLNDAPPILKCKKCSSTEFEAEKDIMDTWATSSLTPQLCTQLVKDENVRKKLFPMSLRPQAHDIITFWLFNTVIKSQLHYKKNPWRDVMISGWALDPQGKKMSKSKGNVVEPEIVVGKYGADALRFWAAGSRLGDDLAFQEKDLVTGKKTVTKLWNASKFAIMNLEGYNPEDSISEQLVSENIIDKWLLSKLQKLILLSTESFENYEYARTKLECEKFFFMTFCDNYLEFIKDRIYNSDAYPEQSKLMAQKTLYDSLYAIIRLFAPIMPHITEEIYHLYFGGYEAKKSVHITSWPHYNKDLIDEEAEKIGDIVVDIVSAARKFKSEKSLSQKSELGKIIISCDKKLKEGLESVLVDIIAITSAKEIVFEEADLFSVNCEL